MKKFSDHLPECPLEITNEATQLGNPDWWGTTYWRKPNGTTVTTQLGTHCICDRLQKAEERERSLWERVARDRIDDLMSCHKHDDCHTRADSIEVLLDDVNYFRMSKRENTHNG